MAHSLTVSNNQVYSNDEFTFGLCTQVSDSGPYCPLVAVSQPVCHKVPTLLPWLVCFHSAENESKLLLWWHKAMVLILRQIDYGRDRTSCVHLVRKLAHKIQGFGEDRAHSGLLGAIGLGKKSALSEKYVT